MTAKEENSVVLLTIPQLSEKYGISCHTIRKWIKDEKFPALKAGRKSLINVMIFEDFLFGGIW